MGRKQNKMISSKAYWKRHVNCKDTQNINHSVLWARERQNHKTFFLPQKRVPKPNDHVIKLCHKKVRVCEPHYRRVCYCVWLWSGQDETLHSLSDYLALYNQGNKAGKHIWTWLISTFFLDTSERPLPPPWSLRPSWSVIYCISRIFRSDTISREKQIGYFEKCSRKFNFASWLFKYILQYIHYKY